MFHFIGFYFKCSLSKSPLTCHLRVKRQNVSRTQNEQTQSLWFRASCCVSLCKTQLHFCLCSSGAWWQTARQLHSTDYQLEEKGPIPHTHTQKHLFACPKYTAHTVPPAHTHIICLAFSLSLSLFPHTHTCTPSLPNTKTTLCQGGLQWLQPDPALQPLYLWRESPWIYCLGLKDCPKFKQVYTYADATRLKHVVCISCCSEAKAGAGTKPSLSLGVGDLFTFHEFGKWTLPQIPI